MLDAHCTWRNQAAQVVAGPYAFVVECPLIVPSDHATVDFAIFGLAILSMSANTGIHVGQPVSRDTVVQIEKLRLAFELWDIAGLGPLQLTFSNIVDSQRQGAENKIVCLSGGIDSGYAAIRAKRDLGFTHALLIAGADYPHEGGPAFEQLAARVACISGLIGLEPVILRTSIRNVPFNWEMLHSLTLGMCLNFLAPKFAGGGFALDHTGPQELYIFPWGNSRPLATLLSRPSFPIASFGADEDRLEKLRVIVTECPEAADHLSVCWEDRTTGGNCGTCHKCARTRLGFHAMGIDEPAAFPHRPALETLISKWPMPTTAGRYRAMRLIVLELLSHLPHSPYRPYLLDYARRLSETPFAAKR